MWSMPHFFFCFNSIKLVTLIKITDHIFYHCFSTFMMRTPQSNLLREMSRGGGADFLTAGWLLVSVMSDIQQCSDSFVVQVHLREAKSKVVFQTGSNVCESYNNKITLAEDFILTTWGEICNWRIFTESYFLFCLVILVLQYNHVANEEH